MFFVPPIIVLAYATKSIYENKEAFLSSKAIGWCSAILVPLYPFVALVLLMNSYSDEGAGMFAGLGGAAVYYPVATITLLFYAIFTKYKLLAGAGITLCLIPIAAAFVGVFSGISPH